MQVFIPSTAAYFLTNFTSKQTAPQEWAAFGPLLHTFSWFGQSVVHTTAFLTTKHKRTWPAVGTDIMVLARGRKDSTGSGWIGSPTKDKQRAEWCQSCSAHKAKPTAQHSETREQTCLYRARMSGVLGLQRDKEISAPVGECKEGLEQSLWGGK